MIQVYSPANSAEAHMLTHLLEQNGIRAHIHGEALQGGVGDLPASGLLQLLVADEQHEQARQVIRNWEKASTPAETVDRRGLTMLASAIVFLVGLAGGWMLRDAAANNAVPLEVNEDRLDLNGDNRDDLTYFFRIGAAYAHRSEGDRNFDGRTDYVERFGADGIIESHEADDNFDGVFETRTSYRAGKPIQTLIDSSGQTLVGVTIRYENGVIRREEITDFRTGRIVRVNHYASLRLERAEIDLDRDGSLETVRSFDPFGEVTAETRSPR